MAAVLVLLAVAAAPARAETGTLLLPPGGEGEVEIPARGPGDRIAYRFNVTPREVVEFSINYLKDGATITERAKANVTDQVGTFFPLRRTMFSLDYKNWLDRTLTVEWEWHYVRPIPPTREVPAAPLAALALLGAAALLRRPGGS